MFRNEAKRTGWLQAIPKTSTVTLKPNRVAAFIKTVIVALALRGLLPYRVADWLIQRGGLSNV